MAPAKKTIEFTAKNVKAFTSWLRRFASIDNSLLLEIDEKTSTFIAKTYNEERNVVKMSQIKFDDAGLTTKPNKEPKRIKVGIYNIPRLIKIIDQFNDMEFNITINYQDLISEEAATQYAGELILLKNKNLKMSVDCTSLNIFKYIPDDLFKNSIAAIDVLGSFELTKANIEKINSLCALDNEDTFIQFKFENNAIYVSGGTFELLIYELENTSASIKVFKEQYSNIDVENYKVEMGEDRLVFKSVDSDTTCVISMTSDSESE
jgi:hypothetical protein